jgi:hypothetical protein
VLNHKCVAWASGLWPCGEKRFEFDHRTVEPHGPQAMTASLAIVSGIPVLTQVDFMCSREEFSR